MSPLRTSETQEVNSVRYDIRKYYLTERIVNMRNILPDFVVNSSTIKNRLDRHWSKQEMMYN